MGAPPPNPRDLARFCRPRFDFYMSWKLRMANHPQPGPAPESALGLRPRIALSSAQVA